jgi:hypothetical protein
MMDIILINILHPKIVDNEGEGNRARFMIPQTRHVDVFKIAKRHKFAM